MVIPLLSVTHGQCDARPMVTFPPCAGTKFILLGDSIRAWIRSLDLISRPARIRTRAGTGDQASKHVLSLAVAHATAMLSRQLQ